MKTDNSQKILRPSVKGKFLHIGDEKFYVKGVTYGTFAPDEKGKLFPSLDRVEQDFQLMAQNGVNAVRTYTVPSIALLDMAAKHGLKVMVGLPWEQHITFLDSRKRIHSILENVKYAVASCRQHPAILCYTVGNEIPASIVRWYGKKKIEKFLFRLYKAVKQVDPLGLVTYVNYPTTEYLSLPFMDFDCFNVYLETEEKLESYLARLHNLCEEKPLVLAEIGLDSLRNGVDKQAEVLKWQIELAFAKGCAGAFVFAWTDEWWRGGSEIEDWDFGLVDRDRNAKPALTSMEQVFANVPFSTQEDLPSFSIVVCSYNGSSTIRDTMEGLLKLDYPNYEVIVVNDGSTDQTAEIVSEYPFQLISTENQGLSNARNTGMYAAKGDIVAYIDDDAYPDVHWLRYLAFAYMSSDHVGIGGPNLAPSGDGFIASCVVNSPGGPVHVLTTDEIAEHIPGCNMTFRREALLAVGGCDPIYRAAGDDVDLCWRIQDQVGTIGFHPSAFVWHHRRNSVKMYWKQQKGYGKAEALLERKWPEKYNDFGHLSWGGRIYGNGLTNPINLKKSKVYHGPQGSALFQSVYEPAPYYGAMIPLMPEWYFLVVLLGVSSLLSAFWAPLLVAIPLFVIALGVVFVQAFNSARKATYQYRLTSRWSRIQFTALTTLLHVIQPIARLYGRIKHGLTPWRNRVWSSATFKVSLARVRTQTLWSEVWVAREEWLEKMEASLVRSQVRVRKGNDFDRWDVETRSGLFARLRGILTIEEHGGGKQFIKFKTWPVLTWRNFFIPSVLFFLVIAPAMSGAYVVSIFFGLLSSLLFVKYILDMESVMKTLRFSFASLLNDTDADANLDEPDEPDEPAQKTKVHTLIKKEKVNKVIRKVGFALPDPAFAISRDNQMD